MPDYRLYWYPGTCSRVPFVALEEIGEPFDLVLVDRAAVPDPTYLKINLEGRVPTLVHHQRVVTENLAIQTYLARRHPGAKLLPLEDSDRAISVLETHSWFASHVHLLVRQFRFPRNYSDDPDAHASIRAKALPQLEHAFATIDGRLRGREWLFGEWSLLDVYLLWLWFRATGSGFDGSHFPNCIDHALRCESRPSVAKVLDYEEMELARLRDANLLPDWLPGFQAGRSPVPIFRSREAAG